MAIVDSALLTSPLDGEDPCGPDLDASGDAAFLNFFAFAPFQFPDRFFDDGRPFDPSAGDFREATAQIPAMLAELMKRSRDLRLLAFLARFAILKRRLDEFADVVAAMALLLDQRWDGVHPRARGDGSFEARVSALEELDDPLVLFSLQFVTLLSDRRHGNVAYRSLALAAEAEQREDGVDAREKYSGRIAALTEAQIVQSFKDAGQEAIAGTRRSFQRLSASIQDIRDCFADKASGRETPNLEKLLKVVRDVLALFEAAFPSAAEPFRADEALLDDRVSAGSRSRISCAAQARRALESAKDYFRRYEPSSPALPLVAQALELQGKTFVEVLAVLAPDCHASAYYSIGDRRSFKLAVAPLGEMTRARSEYFEERRTRESRRIIVAAPELRQAPEPVAADLSESEAPVDAEATRSAAESELASAAPDAPTASLAAESNSEAIAFSRTDDDMEEPSRDDAATFSAETRAQALSLLNDIAAYFRDAEPSSPIPWLADRACALAEKDFLSVLGAVFERDLFLSSS